MTADRPASTEATPPIPTNLCLRCGYALTDLPDSGPCPECGTPVELSRKGMLLTAAGPDHRAAIMRGLRWMFVSTLLLCLVPPAVSYLAFLLGNRPAPGPPVVGHVSVTSALLFAITAAPWLASAAGLLWFTRPLRFESRPMSARRTARWALPLPPLALVAADLLEAPALLPLVAILVLLQLAAIVAHARVVARAIPDAALVTHAERCVGTTLGAAFIFLYVGVLVTSPLRPVTSTIIVAAGPLFVAADYLFLLFRLHDRIATLHRNLAATPLTPPPAA